MKKKPIGIWIYGVIFLVSGLFWIIYYLTIIIAYYFNLPNLRIGDMLANRILFLTPKLYLPFVEPGVISIGLLISLGICILKLKHRLIILVLLIVFIVSAIFALLIGFFGVQAYSTLIVLSALYYFIHPNIGVLFEKQGKIHPVFRGFISINLACIIAFLCLVLIIAPLVTIFFAETKWQWIFFLRITSVLAIPFLSRFIWKRLVEKERKEEVDEEKQLGRNTLWSYKVSRVFILLLILLVGFSIAIPHFRQIRHQIRVKNDMSLARYGNSPCGGSETKVFRKNDMSLARYGNSPCGGSETKVFRKEDFVLILTTSNNVYAGLLEHYLDENGVDVYPNRGQHYIETNSVNLRDPFLLMVRKDQIEEARNVIDDLLSKVRSKNPGLFTEIENESLGSR